MSDYPQPEESLISEAKEAHEQRIRDFNKWCADLERVNEKVGGGFNSFSPLFFLVDDERFGLPPTVGVTPNSRIILGGQDVITYLLDTNRFKEIKTALAERGRRDEFLMASAAYDPGSSGDVYLITHSPFYYNDMRYHFTLATQPDLNDLVPAIMAGRLTALRRENTVTFPPVSTQPDVKE